MKAHIVPAAIGFVLFALFVGYVAVRIAAPPLLAITALVLVMCLVDFVRGLRED
jgi:hypothetical protein